MADRPSRALILYGYGLAPHISPSHSHIHTVASRGCCGFLALDDPSSSPVVVAEDEKLIRELAQLLDAREAVCMADGKEGSKEALTKVPGIAERFMGMRAAIVTSASAIRCFGEKLGFTAVGSDTLRDGQSSEGAAIELLKLLGFQDGKSLERDNFDLVFLHIGAHVKDDRQKDLEYMNSLVGSILQAAQPGSEIGSRLHLSVVMSYGTFMEDDPNLSLMSLSDSDNSGYSSLFPRQSYTLRGVNIRNGIRHRIPMLIAQWQDAVTRWDLAEEFSFNEFKKHSGNLAIPADRFVHEVAFKLWKAPKYGA